MPLTQTTVERIGNIVGLFYTEFNGVGTLSENASDGEFCFSGRAHLSEVHGYKLLIFTGNVSGHIYSLKGTNKTNSIYVLNLNTLKPTKNSYRQDQIPTELKNQIRIELGQSEPSMSV